MEKKPKVAKKWKTEKEKFEYKNKRKRVAEAMQHLPAPAIEHLADAEQRIALIPDAAERRAYLAFLKVLIAGGLHRDAMAAAGYDNWNSVARLHSKHRELSTVYRQVREIGEDYRKVLRSDSAHLRAVDGVEEPIFSPKGEFLGSKRVYSDRLLEVLLKADDPERFRDRKEIDVKGTVINLTPGFDRGALKEELAQADVTEEEDC